MFGRLGTTTGAHKKPAANLRKRPAAQGSVVEIPPPFDEEAAEVEAGAATTDGDAATTTSADVAGEDEAEDEEDDGFGDDETETEGVQKKPAAQSKSVATPPKAVQKKPAAVQKKHAAPSGASSEATYAPNTFNKMRLDFMKKYKDDHMGDGMLLGELNKKAQDSSESKPNGCL
jgi:hypothetical protein